MVFDEGKMASSAISEVLSRHPDWSDRKRALFSNMFHDLIRWWRLLWTGAGRKPSTEDRWLWHVLGVLLLRWEDVPPRGHGFRGIPWERVRKRLERAGRIRAVRESIPDELDLIGERELGNEWDRVLRALNSHPPLAVRANRLKVDAGGLKDMLREEGLGSTRVRWAPDALVLKRKTNIFRTSAFREGYLEVQDPASQAVAPFLDVRPGLRVIDACAGQGGKTLHLSALMENTGRIIAMDDVAWKLEMLKKRARRAGAFDIRTVHVSSPRSYRRFRGAYDRVLVDAPCSGLGSLRRNPDIKWSFSSESLDRLRELQRRLISDYSGLVREGGKMVYATCSILPSEGEEQVGWFLGSREGWVLEEERRFRPDVEGFDGFYMARLLRKDGGAG
ncbi:MAG: RNA methyltransferase [Thermoplasmata archaeon]|nr:MAG: RNA methyltransferase [Thermoplasmata archaeon]